MLLRYYTGPCAPAALGIAAENPQPCAGLRAEAKARICSVKPGPQATPWFDFGNGIFDFGFKALRNGCYAG